MAGLMLWMEEKGLMLVDEPSQEPSNILQKLKWHKAAECELQATHGHVEALQQVGAWMEGAGPAGLQVPCPAARHVIMEHSLEEESSSVPM